MEFSRIEDNRRKRVFLGIALTPEIAATIKTLLAPLKLEFPRLRWTIPSNWHITIKFMGEIEAGLLFRLTELMKIVALKVSRFFLKLNNIDIFPAKQGHLLAIYLQLTPELKNLFTLLDNALIALAIPKETHSFIPHITLARFSEKIEFKSIFLKNLNFFANKINIYETLLGAKGSEYRILKEVSFI